MENPITYKYDDWLNGKVIINGAIIFNEKNEKVVMVDYDNFEIEDQQEIRKRQKEYFEIEVNNLLLNHTKQFESRYSNSELKDTLINEEIQQCYEIMFGEIPNSNYVHLKFWTPIFIDTDLHEIQQYIDNVIKKGIIDKYEYIQSPNSPFLNKNKPDNRIYAMFIWKYYLWLEKFNENYKSYEKSTNYYTNSFTQNIQNNNEINIALNLNVDNSEHVNNFNNENIYNITNSLNKEVDDTKFNGTELKDNIDSKTELSDPINSNKKNTQPKFPQIFIDINAENFFLELKELTVKKNTELADYSYIFHTMKRYELLINNLRHKDFMDFLNKNHGTDISVNKFSFKNPNSKLPILESLLKKYYPNLIIRKKTT